MTYPEYPLDKLPYPVRDNFSSQYGASFKPVQMDDAHNRIRRRYAMQPVNYSLTWNMTFAEFEWFEAFLRYDCAQASGYFTMPLNAVSDPLTLRFVSYPDVAFDEGMNAWVVSGAVEWIRNAPIGGTITSLPTFPLALPDPEKANYSIKRADTVTRSNIPEGLARERTRYLDETAVAQMQWTLTPDEYTVFDDFVHNTLLGGLAPFAGMFVNGSGIKENQRLQMIEAPQVKSNLSGYDVTCTFEVHDMPIISELEYRGQNKMALADTIHYAASVSMQQTRYFADQIGFIAGIKFAGDMVVGDTLGFYSTITMVEQGVDSMEDNVRFNDMLSFALKLAPLSDTVAFTASGSIIANDYIADYIEFGYFGTQFPFAN